MLANMRLACNRSMSTSKRKIIERITNAVVEYPAATRTHDLHRVSATPIDGDAASELPYHELIAIPKAGYESGLSKRIRRIEADLVVAKKSADRANASLALFAARQIVTSCGSKTIARYLHRNRLYVDNFDSFHYFANVVNFATDLKAGGALSSEQQHFIQCFDRMVGDLGDGLLDTDMLQRLQQERNEVDHPRRVDMPDLLDKLADLDAVDSKWTPVKMFLANVAKAEWK
jgi:hypothetical protein